MTSPVEYGIGLLVSVVDCVLLPLVPRPPLAPPRGGLGPPLPPLMIRLGWFDGVRWGEEVILVAKPEIILVAKYSGGKTSLKYLITPPAHNQLYMCRGKKKKYFLRVLIILSLP